MAYARSELREYKCARAQISLVLCRVHPSFAALTLNPSPRAGEGL